MPKVWKDEEPENLNTPDPPSDMERVLLMVSGTLKKMNQRLDSMEKEMANLREWVQIAVNRPWMHDGKPPRKDKEIPF
jgi:hypothetical protein